MNNHLPYLNVEIKDRQGVSKHILARLMFTLFNAQFKKKNIFIKCLPIDMVGLFPAKLKIHFALIIILKKNRSSQ